MDITQKFDWVTCDTIVSELDVNPKYRILRAKGLTTRFRPPLWFSPSMGEDAAPAPTMSRWMVCVCVPNLVCHVRPMGQYFFRQRLSCLRISIKMVIRIYVTVSLIHSSANSQVTYWPSAGRATSSRITSFRYLDYPTPAVPNVCVLNSFNASYARVRIFDCKDDYVMGSHICWTQAPHARSDT